MDGGIITIGMPIATGGIITGLTARTAAAGHAATEKLPPVAVGKVRYRPIADISDSIRVCGMPKKVKWRSAPKSKDYEGAKNFLTLLCSEGDADRLIKRLKQAEPIERAPKDLLRAAALPLLSEDNAHVSRDLKDVHAGKALPPVLLVRGDLKNSHRLVVADGYHRICASYHLDEERPVSCRIVDL
jgi:hypothetical protein